MGTRPVQPAAWQEQVIAKANFVDCERVRLLSACKDDDHIDHDHIDAATKLRLDDACRAAGIKRNGEPLVERGSRTSRLADWWTGAPIKGAFAHLHAAVVELVDLYTEDDIKARSPGVLARMQVCLAPTDRRRREALELFGPQASNASTGTTSPPRRGGQKTVLQTMRGRLSRGDGNAAAELARRRAAFREAMKFAYEAADEQHARARSLRNVLITTAALLTVLVVLVCVVGWLFPEAIPLCFESESACPSTDGATPQRGDVPIVALMGMLGGAMSATFAIQKLRTTPTPIPNDLQVSLAFLKLPAGALTAIGGLVLIHGEFIPGLTDLDSQGQILAYAIVLGVAQQLVTGFVDKKAEEVLAAVPSKGRRPAELDGETQATGQETLALTSTGMNQPRPS